MLDGIKEEGRGNLKKGGGGGDGDGDNDGDGDGGSGGAQLKKRGGKRQLEKKAVDGRWLRGEDFFFHLLCRIYFSITLSSAFFISFSFRSL